MLGGTIVKCDNCGVEATLVAKGELFGVPQLGLPPDWVSLGQLQFHSEACAKTWLSTRSDTYPLYEPSLVAQDYADALNRSVGRTVTKVVAAVDASSESKVGADRVCTGVNDQVEIQAALDTVGDLGGGAVCGQGGSFSLNNSISVGTNVTLQDFRLSQGANFPADTPLVLVDGQYYPTLSNIRISGDNDLRNAFGVKVSSSNQIWWLIQNVYVSGCKIGFLIEDGTINNYLGKLIGCEAYGCNIGYKFTEPHGQSCHIHSMLGCSSWNISEYGLYIDTGADSITVIGGHQNGGDTPLACIYCDAHACAFINVWTEATNSDNYRFGSSAESVAIINPYPMAGGYRYVNVPATATVLGAYGDNQIPVNIKLDQVDIAKMRELFLSRTIGFGTDRSSALRQY